MMKNFPGQIPTIVAILLCQIALYFLHADRHKLWFDESVQLSISHGADPETLQPYAFPADVASVVDLNQRYNMDPGGFTLLLTFLSPWVGNHFYVYRLISGLAYAAGAAVILVMLFGGLTRMRAASAMLAASAWLLSLFVVRSVMKFLTDGPGMEIVDNALSFLPFHTLSKSALFARPYGLEVIFIAMVLAMGDWYLRREPRKYLYVSGVMLLGILMTRYDFSIFLLSYLLAVATHVWMRGGLPGMLRFRWTWAVAGSVLLGLAIVYFFGYARQMGGSVTPNTLYYLKRSYLVSAENWAYFFTVPRNLVACIMLLIVAVRMARGRVEFLELLFAIVFVCYLTLSIMGFHPFNFSMAQCVAMIILMDTLLVAWSLRVVRRAIPVRNAILASTKRLSPRLGRYAWLPVAVVSAIFVGRDFRSNGKEAMFLSMVGGRYATPMMFDRTLDTFLSARKDARVFIDRLATPNVNCFYIFSGRPIPRNIYRCESIGPHNMLYRRMPSFQERFDQAIRYDCDYYYIPELNFDESVRKGFLAKGYVLSDACPYMYGRGPAATPQSGRPGR